jgi:hypothetical protein
MLTIYATEVIVRAEACRAGVIIQTDRPKMAPGTSVYPIIRDEDRFISVPSSNCKMTSVTDPSSGISPHGRGPGTAGDERQNMRWRVSMALGHFTFGWSRLGSVAGRALSPVDPFGFS